MAISPFLLNYDLSATKRAAEMIAPKQIRANDAKSPHD